LQSDPAFFFEKRTPSGITKRHRGFIVYRSIIIAVLAVTTLSCQSPQTEEGSVWIFYTGRDYLGISTRETRGIPAREVYVAGVNDGVNLLASVNRQYQWLIDCSTGKTSRDLESMFTHWLEANESRWEEPAARLYVEALRQDCMQQSI
jgi:hypothetical protein